ncbi:acetylornithine aminotransferase [Fomitiporia mediterranea MF3/22]|uniref:acetylornithine aminotransferase n=1 Tax=Fomitiporia mediterranea (strain MF3/22) TaxID=694068 RepID=UPI0004408B19|nr:acetylornithine aminotransferase [Fomitiporia mediterranea MF3/22]EJD02937.1 acetylornithine aminotransferase [Fomitiporia mediterranea MF3/22]
MLRRFTSVSAQLPTKAQAIGRVSNAHLAKRTLSTSSSESLLQIGSKHVTKGLGRLTEAIITKGEGSYVTLHDGRKMLDFTCGIGVTSLGHCHPKISKAAAEQCMSLTHGQVSIAYHAPYLQLIEKLLPVMPDPSLDSFFFWNSGSEAVEASVKMARQFTGRQNVIVMQGGYHGRTFGAMALTKSKTIYFDGSEPLMPGAFTMPFPYWHQFGVPASTSEEELVGRCLYQLELLLSQQTAPSRTAAILLEPVLGEGGYVPAPASFLKGLREVADKHGIMLILDEVQSGFGRTGKYFATEYSGVRPDMLIIAKGIANGFPLSGVVTRKELTDKLKPGSMGGTYAGNAVACAAGVACAEVMKEESVLENAQQRSKELVSSLNELRANSTLGKHILDIRGLGLMIGVEFASPSTLPGDIGYRADTPKDMASRVAKRCIEKGMYILTTSIYQVVRFIPPLNTSQQDLAKGCQIFAEAVEEVVREG